MSNTLNFDTGTNGATLTTGNGISFLAGAPQYSTTAMHGGMAMHCSSGTANTAIGVDLTATTHAFSCYVMSPTTNSTRINLVAWGTLANATAFNLRLEMDNRIGLANAASSQVAQTVGTTTPGSWFRLDTLVDTSVPSAPVVTTRLFLNPESTAHSEQLSWTFSGTTNTVQRPRFGVVGSAAVATRDIYMDTVRITDGLAWPAPFNPPPPVGDSDWSYIQGGLQVPLALQGVMAGGVLVPTVVI
jgi:hypothetical protein